MSDDLVKRLRSSLSVLAQEEAADRIEELEAELDYWRMDSAAAWDTCEEHRVKLAKAVVAIQSIASNTCCDTCQEAALVARATLAALEEKKDA